ncbi:MAG: glycosyltransferase family 4 protein [bacterium]
MSKNIVFLNSHYSWGGGENWTLLTAKGLADRGYNIWIAGREGSEIIKRAKSKNLNTKIVNLHNTLSCLNPLKIVNFKNFLKNNMIDILFLNLSRDRKFGAICGSLADTNRIIYRRGVDRPLKKRFYSKWLYGRALTDIIANSKSTKKNIMKNLEGILDRDKVKLIYNGVEIPEKIEPTFSLREDYNIKSNEKILINVGRLAPEKGHDLLLEGMKELNKTNQNWNLFIIGEGDEKNNILKLIDHYNLNNQVYLTGFVDNVNEYLIQADLMVHSARIEGFGLVLVEAMATGLPVVAVSASNIPEVVEDGKVGLLAKKENPEDLAKKVNNLLKDDNLRSEFANNAKDFVKNNFSIDKMIDKYEQLLN